MFSDDWSFCLDLSDGCSLCRSFHWGLILVGIFFALGSFLGVDKLGHIVLLSLGS